MERHDNMKFMHDKTLDETQITSKQAFNGGLLKLWVDKVKLPNGKEATREMIKHQGAVGILPILPDGSMVFVKQCRYAINSVIYEIPAGKLEIGEDHLECAKRELSEETGYKAVNWEKLTSIVTTPGFTNETIHLYIATDLTLEKQHPDPDEFLNVVILKPEQVKKMVLDEEIFDAKTLAALLVYFYKKALR
jgi:ADP-ribose pyrophosphatase